MAIYAACGRLVRRGLDASSSALGGRLARVMGIHERRHDLH